MSTRAHRISRRPSFDPSSLATSLALALGVAAAFVASAAPATDWAAWRGVDGTGVASSATPPVTWSEETNVCWKVPIPGKGHASPIVVGDRVFVLTAVPAGSEAEALASKEAPPPKEGERPRGVSPDHPLDFVVLALSRDDGRELWRRTAVSAQPHEGTHTDATWASASPVSDGERLYAFFGSRGLFVYDLDGKLLWHKDFGDMTTRRGFGEGASPALSKDFVLVNWDHEEDDSFLVALDKATGEERWRVARDEPTSWSTPLVLERSTVDLPEGVPEQVVVAASNATRGYALSTGEPLWQLGGLTLNVVPTPVYADGHVYVTSGFRGAALQAIRLEGAKGALEGTESVVWSLDADTPYVPSPVLVGGQLYYLKVNNAILTSVDAATGETAFGPVRLDGLQGVYSSPVAAGDHVYIVGRNGATLVLRHGKELDVVAVNELDDSFAASPALSGDRLFLRGAESLYCLREEPPKPSAGTGGAGSAEATVVRDATD